MERHPSITKYFVFCLASAFTSLLVFPVTSSADMPLEPTDVTPSTTSTPSLEPEPSADTEKCVQQVVEEPSPIEKCRLSPGVYMGKDKNGNLIFSEDRGKIEDYAVSVYSIVQKNFELRKLRFEEGFFTGYNIGFSDAVHGKPKIIVSPKATLQSEEYGQGYRSGIDDGYAAGLFEKNFKRVGSPNVP